MSNLSGTAQEKLLAVRERAHLRGCSEGSKFLRQLLSDLHAPATLPGGLQIARNACNLLQYASNIVPRNDRRQIKRYIRELRWVIRHARRLALLAFVDAEERKRFLCCTGNNPVLGAGAKDHGLWCLLWEHHPDRCLIRSFSALQLHALIAQLAILQHWKRHDEWAPGKNPANTILHSLYVRTLAIRHWVMTNYASTSAYRDNLRKISVRGARVDQLTALQRIRRDLKQNLHGDEGPPQILKDVVDIIGLIKCAEDPDRFPYYRDEADDSVDGTGIDPSNEPTETTSEPPGTHDSPADDSDCQVECMDDLEDEEDEGAERVENQDDDWESDDSEEGDGEDHTASIYSRSKWTPEEKKACSEDGVHPAEVLPAERFLLSDRRSGGSRYWVAMKNQLLSLAWQNIAMEEVAQGLELLRRAADRGGLLDLELLTLVNAILARSLTESGAKSLVIRSDRPSEVDALTLILPVYVDAAAEWLIPAVPIPYHEAHKGPYPGCRQCAKCFPLPDYWGVGTLMRRLIALKFPDWNGQPIQPFSNSEEEDKGQTRYGRRLKDSLTREDPDRAQSLRDRFTLPRLGRVLFQRIYDQTCGNLVLVTYATGRKHPCGEVDRYYDTPAVSTIQAVDQRASSSIHEELAAVGYFQPSDLKLKPSDSSGYVGSPLCPLVASVQEFLSRTMKTILQADARLAHSDNVADIILRHNAYTVYTYASVTIGTCHRPAGGGIPDLDVIDRFNGMLSIIDKGAEKARLAAVADAAFAQRSSYHDYVVSFDFAKYLGKDPEQQVFFLGPDGEILLVTPSTLKEHLPFVANFARHLVRTVLAEWCEQGDRRLSPERLSALLGHASEGEEPHGVHSSFDYQAFCEATRSALRDLLEQIGFHPITFQGREIAVHDPTVRRFLGSPAA